MKWAGTAACLLLATAWVFSGRYTPSCRGRTTRVAWITAVMQGRLWINLGYADQLTFQPPLAEHSCVTDVSDNGYWAYGYDWRLERRSGLFEALVPIWAPLLLLATPTAYLWLRDRRRFGPGRCPRCGYDLAGLSAGAGCPECGRGAV